MKNKNTGLNMKQWKEFRYDLVKEDIEIAADNEEDIQNWMNEPDEPHVYQLKNGKTLTIKDDDIPGMAGELTAYVSLQVDGKNVLFNDIKNLMQADDADQLKNYLDGISAHNAQSANDWVREGKKSLKYFDVAKWREKQKSIVRENADNMSQSKELENLITNAVKHYDLDYETTKKMFLQLSKNIFGKGLLKLIKLDLHKFGK